MDQSIFSLLAWVVRYACLWIRIGKEMKGRYIQCGEWGGEVLVRIGEGWGGASGIEEERGQQCGGGEGLEGVSHNWRGERTVHVRTRG